MNVLATSSEPVAPGTMVTIIVGVLAVSALLWVDDVAAGLSGRTSGTDPRYVRRWLILFGVLYGFGGMAIFTSTTVD